VVFLNPGKFRDCILD